ncbi:uncharacterized protein [Nerophis lumbriciformis]|uniref:uncharacterized protein isoform X1 n=1 Tax=Nerophis lumbriciformis TaxID=546530 RepID=UPI002ADFCF98|nr:uncharacterized protein LOC133577581 isoform X1 [Nerophis lumbriciformis]
MDHAHQSEVQVSSIVVVNIIWWMVMIAGISLGAIHVGLCPVQPNIPVYLMVLGVSSLLSLCVTYCRCVWDSGVMKVASSLCMTLLHLFTFCWFIADVSPFCDHCRHTLDLQCLSTQLYTRGCSVLPQNNLPVCFCGHHNDVGRHDAYPALRRLPTPVHLLHNSNGKMQIDTRLQYLLRNYFSSG